MIAQERIWAWEQPGGLGSVRGWKDKQCDATEYTRTDLIPAMIAEAVAKERERWQAMSMVDFANQMTTRSIAAIRSGDIP